MFKSLPRLGSDLNIDMDKVEDYTDLVLASLSVPGMERNIEELEKRKIPFVIVPIPEVINRGRRKFIICWRSYKYI